MIALVLFCGAGGATEGMVRAGLDVRLAVDGWQAACVAHRRWHPTMPVVRARIEDVHRVARGPFDLVWASPSCKPYSMANRTPKRGRAHPEWYDLAHLVVQFVATGARWLVVENVCGLLWSKEGKIEMARMQRACDAARLRMTVNVINSNTVGVAQIRRRLIVVVGPEFVAIPHGSDYIPPANAAHAAVMAIEGTKGTRDAPYATAGKGCVANEHGLARSRMTRERWGVAQRAICGPDGERREKHVAQRAVGREDRRTAAQIGARASEHDGSRRNFRDTQGRTLAECCALQMIPEFVVAGLSKRVAHELVGNACPPPLTEHAVRVVMRADADLLRLLRDPTRRAEAETLERRGMGSAAFLQSVVCGKEPTPADDPKQVPQGINCLSHNVGAPMDHATGTWAGTSSDRAGASSERRSVGQSPEQLGSGQSSDARVETHDASDQQDLCSMSDDLHAAQDETEATKDVREQ